MLDPYEIPKCDVCGQRLREDWEVESGLCERHIDEEAQRRDNEANSTRHISPEDFEYGGRLWIRGEH